MVNYQEADLADDWLQTAFWWAGLVGSSDAIETLNMRAN